MAAAVWPSVLLGLAACCVAFWRCGALALTSAGDASRLAAALSSRLERGDSAGALTLCRALPGCWAADCASYALSEARDPEEAAVLIEEQRSAYRSRAELGLGALRAFSRMAFPLALGSAIIALSTPLAGATALQDVERALGAALQCVTVGLLTNVFCRTSSQMLRQQAGRRMHEISVVSRVLRKA